MQKRWAVSTVGILSFMALTNAHARLEVYKVVAERKYVVIKATSGESLQPGTLIEVTQSGQKCTLEVSNSKGTWIAANGKNCPIVENLDKDAKVKVLDGAPKKGARSENTPPPSSSSKSNRTRFHHLGVSFHYNFANSVYEKINTTGTLSGVDVSGATKTTYTSSGAFGLGLNYTYLKVTPDPRPEFNLGGMLGFNYELGRKLTQGVDQDGTSTTYRDLNFKVSYFELNLIGEVSHFYGFIGPNWSMVTIDGADKSAGLSYSGSLGAQFGAGYLYESFFGEILYRSINGKASGTSGSLKYESEYLRLWGIALRFGYHFSL